MTKEQLIESAQKLVQPAPDVVEEYSLKRIRMVSEINRIMLARQDLADLIKEGNEAMMQNNHNNHALFMESILGNYNPEVLVETVLWVFRAYRSHGLQLTYWSAHLNVWLQVIEKELTPDSYQTILPFYNWLIVNIPIFSKLTDTQSE